MREVGWKNVFAVRLSTYCLSRVGPAWRKLLLSSLYGMAMSMQKRKRYQTRHKRIALKFFDFKWFDALCGIAGANPKILREVMQREFFGEK